MGYATGGGGGGAAFCGCKVRLTTTQVIANNTVSAVDFATSVSAEDWDTDAFHNPASNSTRLTVPAGKGGKYRITALALWGGSATGLRQISIFVNGAVMWQVDANGLTGFGGVAGQEAMLEIALVATDYVEMKVDQTSGGNLNLFGEGDIATGTGASLTLTKIG